MTDEVIDYRFRLRRGLAATWTSVNDLLLVGEIGLEKDTGLFKIGDGVTAWNSLPYHLSGKMIDFDTIADGQVMAWSDADNAFKPSSGLSEYTDPEAPQEGAITPPTKCDKYAQLRLGNDIYAIPIFYVKTIGEVFIKLTIDKTKVAGSHTDYPCFIDLSLMPAEFWDAVKDGGGDIRCYSDTSKTTEFAREVVSCDKTNEIGELYVKLDAIDNSNDFEFYVLVDGESRDYLSSDTYGRNAVWSDFYAVMHMQGALTDSTGSSTVNDDFSNITFSGGNAIFNEQQCAYIAKNPNLGSGDFCFYARVTPKTATSSYSSLFGQWGRGAINTRSFNLFYTNNGDIQFSYSTNGNNQTSVTATSALTLGDEATIIVKRESTALKMYVDGTLVKNENIGSTAFYNPTSYARLDIGSSERNNASYPYGYAPMKADLDEFYFVKGSYNAELTMYANQNSPITFFKSIAVV